MPGLRLATFDTDGLEVAGDGAERDERLILQALAVADTAADVVALQGVADMAALEALLLTLRRAVGRDYRHALLLGGNDPGRGHPAVIAQLPIVQARSHRTLSFAEIAQLPLEGLEPGAPVFSRDCLEVAVEQQGRRLCLFVCHFQPTLPEWPLADGTVERRRAEAVTVRQVIEQRFVDPAIAEWVVLGNLGDQPVDGKGSPNPNHGLGPLLDDGFAVELGGDAGGVPAETWTAHDLRTNAYRRHDHILLSPALARRNRRSGVRVIRAGLPYRAERHGGQRYPRIGWLSPAASSHCPIVADLTFNGEAAGHDACYRSGGGRPGRVL